MIEPHTLPRTEPITRSHSSSTSSHLHARAGKRGARTAHLHEIKAFRDRRGGSDGKRFVVHNFKDRENGHDGSLGDVFTVSSSSSFQAKDKNRPQAPFRRPLAPSGLPLRGSEESTDADAWVDTDVDLDADDDASLVSEGAIVLNSPERDMFG